LGFFTERDRWCMALLLERLPTANPGHCVRSHRRQGTLSWADYRA
jgi:hypothetical protein